MQLDLKYGRGKHTLRVPEKADVTILRPAGIETVASLTNSVNDALDDLLGCGTIDQMVQTKGPKSVAIAVPDESRPLPSTTILPVLLERLFNSFPTIDPATVTIIVGGGLHTPLNTRELQQFIPSEAASGCRVIAHDAYKSRLFNLGVTRRGTPVRINAEVAEADLKIVIGQIDPHQFVGFTGGAKGIVIGCASAETIEHNHSLMLDKASTVGRILGNPAREDMNEAGRIAGIDMALNIVLDANNNVVRALAGEPAAVLEEGAKTCADVYGVAIERQYDIVIASCGGYPKDLCLYQAQKGLNLASCAAKPGGKILLLAACPQGVGDNAYFDYVSKFPTPEEVLQDFGRIGFKMGAHKAYLFARTLTRYDVAVISELDDATLNRCQLHPAEPDSILEKWVNCLRERPTMAVVPNANTTYFPNA